MPNERAHIELANRNRAALEHLLTRKNDFPEWVATVSFYRAVHIVEAVFAVGGRHGGDHGERHYILKNPKYHALWHNYRMLWALSTIARYMKEPDDAGGQAGREFTSFQKYLGNDDVESLVVKNLLKGFEAKIRKLNFLSPASCNDLKI